LRNRRLLPDVEARGAVVDASQDAERDRENGMVRAHHLRAAAGCERQFDGAVAIFADGD